VQEEIWIKATLNGPTISAVNRLEFSRHVIDRTKLPLQEIDSEKHYFLKEGGEVPEDFFFHGGVLKMDSLHKSRDEKKATPVAIDTDYMWTSSVTQVVLGLHNKKEGLACRRPLSSKTSAEPA
jgi:hypothetical protein